MHRKEVERTMKYEKPIWELIELCMTDIVCDSIEPGLDEKEEDDEGVTPWGQMKGRRKEL